MSGVGGVVGAAVGVAWGVDGEREGAGVLVGAAAGGNGSTRKIGTTWTEPEPVVSAAGAATFALSSRAASMISGSIGTNSMPAGSFE
jgi:hypothetical protein